MLGRALNFSKELMEEIDNNYTDSSLLNEDEKAALRWAEVVTLKLYQAGPGRKSERPEAVKKLKQYFSDPQIVELTITIGHFNFWNRFTDSLEIDLEDPKLNSKFKKSANIDVKSYKSFMQDCWWNSAND